MDHLSNSKYEALRRWFEVFNTGDLGKMKAVAEELCTPDYRLHDPSYPKAEVTLAEFFEGFEPFMKTVLNPKAEILDVIQEGEKTATRVFYEWQDVETKEHKRGTGIFIHRFENGKIAEEWQVMAIMTEKIDAVAQAEK